MKKIFALLALAFISLNAYADIKGAPFMPETDARFDAIEGKKMAIATYDVAVQGGGSTAHAMGLSLPANATIIRSYLRMVTAMAPAGTTIAVSCQTANNILTATDETGLSNGSWIEGASTGASTAFKDISAACNITATPAVHALTAGKIQAFVEYIVHK